MATNKITVDVRQACEIAGIGRSTLYQLFREEKIRPRKLGRRTLVVVEELRHFLEKLPDGRIEAPR